MVILVILLIIYALTLEDRIYKLRSELKDLQKLSELTVEAEIYLYERMNNNDVR